MKRIALLSLAALASSLAAQSNVVPGLDGRLSLIDDLTYWGRRGAAHPNGEVGISMLNEMCNPGTVNIPWQVAMSSNHPKFGFLLVRVHNGKIEQINDWSYVKHAFTSVNVSGACGPCNNPPPGNLMGVGCSDTYGSYNNGDRYWLGPPEEINPWLGTWAPVGSYFDRGDPAVSGAQAIDGNRSLTQAQVNAFDAVKNRMTVKEQDLLTPGAQYFYGIQLVHEGEAVGNRGDNLASRGTTPTWSGGQWSFPNNSAAMTLGSILTRWPGAQVDVGQNGNDDGRFFVAVVTTSLGGGNFHYEYAIHNVDNHRGGATFRIPIDAGATATNFTFGDIDANPLNDWTAARVGNEIVFSAPANNALNWTTIYNFGFDANFAPGSGIASIDEARVGPGALTVTVPTKVPAGSTFAQVTAVGEGCGGSNCQSSFYQYFTPAGTFDLANSSWSLTFNGSGYTLGPGTGTYAAPAGVNLAMSDDTEVQTAVLPFSIPFPGGSVNRLWVCSNGYVSAASNGGFEYNPNVGSFLSGAPRWSAAWHDLDPSTGQVKVDAQASVVRISYTNVPNLSGGGTATFQFQFFPNGNVNVIYQAVTAAGNDYLVGYSRGNGAADPGSWDISAGLAGGLSLCSGPIPDVALAASARPILGTTIQLDTTNVPAGSLLGLSILSTTQYSPGLDLAVLGMPGCTLYAGLDVISTFPTPGAAGSASWSIPNVPAASGLVVMNQSAIATPGINTFGFVTSNALALVLGIN